MPGWTGGGGQTAESDPASWPYEVERREDVWIELPAADGGAAGPALRLSASLWLPQHRAGGAADEAPPVVPAVLEYLPYRWGDATYYRDYSRHPCASLLPPCPAGAGAETAAAGPEPPVLPRLTLCLAASRQTSAAMVLRLSASTSAALAAVKASTTASISPRSRRTACTCSIGSPPKYDFPLIFDCFATTL